MAAEPRAAEGYRGDGLVAQQPTDNEIDTNWDETVESFDAMELREDLLRGIYAYGFEKPSAIQQVRENPPFLPLTVYRQTPQGACCGA